ncbi:MAG TPA: hypothetical protein PKC49_00710 [Phycisphaerae bacterium]|nr:hypothetical protein [Phycisphaerae bacterium]
MSEPSRSPRTVRLATRPALWAIALLLAFIAGLLVARPAALPAALAQNQPTAGARGIYAFTGQIDAGRFGLFMLDIDQGTLWCYELETIDGVRKLRLVAGRTWIYDRYLQDFNVSGLSYHQVQELIARERRDAAERERPKPADRADLEERPKG